MNELLIECRGLSKSYGHKLALDNLTLGVGRGRIVGLLGPNGSGKTTFLKLLCGLLQPTAGDLTVNGQRVGPETKAAVSYLPDRMYFADWMRATDLFDLFRDFYKDFEYDKALAMCKSLSVEPKDRLKSMSKGTKEKVQLVLVMARKAQLYLLDEPIAGVDPAARDFILRTILTNYNEAGTVLISTHLIADVEKVLDEAIFLKEGKIMLHETVDNIRAREGKSVDALFREIFRAQPMEGGEVSCF
jgi:ABC-2 type transport system ATP-binding protein